MVSRSHNEDKDDSMVTHKRPLSKLKQCDLKLVLQVSSPSSKVDLLIYSQSEPDQNPESVPDEVDWHSTGQWRLFQNFLSSKLG